MPASESIQSRYYLNQKTGERFAIDSYGNLHAPIISGVNDDNISAIVTRLRVNGGCGLLSFWHSSQWCRSLMNDAVESKPTPEWQAQFDARI